MSTLKKRIASARRNPRHVRFADAVAILEALGFREVNVRGSHHAFDNGVTTITIVRPHRNRRFVDVADVAKLLELLAMEVDKHGSDKE